MSQAELDAASDAQFTLVRTDLPMRLFRMVRLAPPDGLGVGRRAVFFVLFTWLPIAVWALVRGRALPGGQGEPLLVHYGVQVLCLVAIPIYVALVFGWLWRLALIAVLAARVSRLDLSWVPTHPDRAGGIGFIESLPSAFSLWVAAISFVAASRWAHQVVHHGADLNAFRVPLIALTVILVALVLAPLLVFAPRLAPARRVALRDYAELVGEHNDWCANAGSCTSRSRTTMC
jgi:hypothetical protein